MTWAFGEVAPGGMLRAIVVFGAGTAAAGGSHASLRFLGPPEETLSGIALDSGLDEGGLRGLFCLAYWVCHNCTAMPEGLAQVVLGTHDGGSTGAAS